MAGLRRSGGGSVWLLAALLAAGCSGGGSSGGSSDGAVDAGGSAGDAAGDGLVEALDMAPADMASADMTPADMTSADMASADMASADMASADMASADMASADMASGDMASGDMAPADMAPADMAPADLGVARGCEHPIEPAGGRLLGLDLLDVPPGGTFEQNLDHAAALGVGVLTAHLPWSAIDDGGALVDPGGFFAAFAAVLAAHDLRFSLTIRPIDLTGKTVPPDLEGVRFSAPEMAARFNAVLDFVVAAIPAERFTSIQIGNEIDGFDASGEHPEFWSDYGVFLAAVAAHAHTLGLRVGFTGTAHGLTTGPLRELGVWRAYAGVVDVVGVTDYLIGDGFAVRAPIEVRADFDRLAAEFPDTPLMIQELGSPTAALNGGDEAHQARFFCEAFAAWDAHRAQIEVVSVLRLYDVTDEHARALAGPYGLDAPAFVDYLRSLGIRRVDGAAKPAFAVIAGEAAARGL